MAAVTMEWESRLGRRLRVRDLYILSTVVRSGSMAKAARELAMSQPAVSEAIANLEHMLHVRLLDRGPRGIEPTIYAVAMLKRSATVFDELKQSVRDVEFLSDPTTGELRIASVESITATILPPVIRRFSQQYPSVVLHIDDVPFQAQALSALQDRKYDLVLSRLELPFSDDPVLQDANVEPLFEDQLVVAAGRRSRWARSRRIDLADLIDEPWMLTAPSTWNYDRVAEAFQARGLALPKVSLVTTSVHLRSSLPADGPFITAVPNSLMLTTASRDALKVLPVGLAIRPWPIAILTLKYRSLSPVVERFIECAREVAKTMAGKSQPHRS
jgi:DNA-binding transcriptional LysR family regulator